MRDTALVMPGAAAPGPRGTLAWRGHSLWLAHLGKPGTRSSPAATSSSASAMTASVVLTGVLRLRHWAKSEART